MPVRFVALIFRQLSLGYFLLMPLLVLVINVMVWGLVIVDKDLIIPDPSYQLKMAQLNLG